MTLNITASKPRGASCRGRRRRRYQLERTLGLDAFPPHEDPVVAKAQVVDGGAAQVGDQLLGFVVESAERRRGVSRERQEE